MRVGSDRLGLPEVLYPALPLLLNFFDEIEMLGVSGTYAIVLGGIGSNFYRFILPLQAHRFLV